MSAENRLESPRSATDGPRATRREWLGLAVIALPCMLYSMDLTVLELALPRISAELQPSGAGLLWIVDIYGFFVAGLLITMGNVGDRIGRRRLLLMGAAAFGVASVVAAMSRSTATLIGARAVLGVAGATLAPSTLSLIRNMFLQERQRTFAVGVWTASYSVGGAMGPLLGGVALRYFHWSAVFLLAVPVMLLLLVAGPRLLPESRGSTTKRLDLASAALSLAAILSFIYGVKRSAQDGFVASSVLSVVAGSLLGGLFVRRQRILADPLVDLRLLRTRTFAASLAMYLLVTVLTFGSYLLVAQHLQLVLGLSPLAAGVWMLPWSASYVVGSFVAPALARRVQPAFVMAAGLLLAATGFLVVARVAGIGVGPVIVGSTLYSLGMSPVFTLGIAAIVAAAPAERAGAAAGLAEAGSELGGALGVAVIGSIATATYRASLARAALPHVPAHVHAAALDTLGGAVAAAARLPVASGAVLLGAAKVAFTHAVQVALGICAVLSVLLSFVAALALRHPRAARSEPTEAVNVDGEHSESLSRPPLAVDDRETFRATDVAETLPRGVAWF